MTSLSAEVERFKFWADAQAKDYGEWECDYDGWEAFRAAADTALAQSRLSDTDVELLLYALARDNECEFIRGMLEDRESNGMCVARVGVTYPDPDARWQLAEFLGTRDGHEARDLLRRLVGDDDEYVRRRALLASVRRDPEFAQKVAWTWLSSAHEYSRLAALSVLHDLGSPQLANAMDLLKNDPSAYVRKKIADIQGAV